MNKEIYQKRKNGILDTRNLLRQEEESIKCIKAFMNRIEHTHFFQPHTMPKPGWKVFIGPTWASAHNLAQMSYVSAEEENALFEESKELIKKALVLYPSTSRLHKKIGSAIEASSSVLFDAIGKNASKYDVAIDPFLFMGEYLKSLNAYGWIPPGSASAVSDADQFAIINAVSNVLNGNGTRAPPMETLSDMQEYAKLMIGLLGISHISIPYKDVYLHEVKGRWDVWESGYALLGKSGADLIVYCNEARFEGVGTLPDGIPIRE
jgi:hypothetical protein